LLVYEQIIGSTTERLVRLAPGGEMNADVIGWTSSVDLA
jgi:hypothetical protein